jgi:hypothetical protein
MAPARRWFERALGVILILIGMAFAAPAAAFLWLASQHMYTVGLSVNWIHILPILIACGIFVLLGGVTLLKR